MLVLAVPLAGCVLPPAVSIASFALDGVSAATSGKTIGDHALSMAAQQDCALWRLLTDEPVCHDFPPGETSTLVAAAAAWAAGGEVVGLGDVPAPAWERTPPRAVALAGGPIVVPPRPGGGAAGAAAVLAAWRPRAIPAAFAGASRGGAGARPRESWAMPITATPSVGPPMPSPEVLDVAPAAGPATPAGAAEREGPGGAQVLVIGSFRRIANARRVAERWVELAASIVSLEVAGIRFYRVVTAPTDAAGIAEQKRRLFEGGTDKVWAAPLCGEGPRRPRCVALPAAARPWRR